MAPFKTYNRMSLNIKKKQFKETNIFKNLKYIHFVLKFFGIFPFTIKQTKSGPKPFISICGAILTIIHITTFTYCFVNVIQLGNDNIAAKYMPKTPLTSFDHLVGIYATSIAVLGLFLNILLTLKAQSKMLTLFYRAELLYGNFVSRKFYKVILICIPYTLNFIIGIVTAIVLFFLMLHRNTINGAFNRFIVLILPHAYIVSKVLHFIFCISFVQLGFDHLCVIMNKISGAMHKNNY